MANTLLIVALPSFRSLWLFLISMHSFSQIADHGYGLPKIRCGLLHRECSWMHLKPTVRRVPCMVYGSSMQATGFQRPQVLITVHMPLSNLRQNYRWEYQANGHPIAQNDQAHPSNVPHALIWHVVTWVIILKYRSKADNDWQSTL